MLRSEMEYSLSNAEAQELLDERDLESMSSRYHYKQRMLVLIEVLSGRTNEYTSDKHSQTFLYLSSFYLFKF
jgi:hypothetical protein